MCQRDGTIDRGIARVDKIDGHQAQAPVLTPLIGGLAPGGGLHLVGACMERVCVLAGVSWGMGACTVKVVEKAC